MILSRGLVWCCLLLAASGAPAEGPPTFAASEAEFLAALQNATAPEGPATSVMQLTSDVALSAEAVASLSPLPLSLPSGRTLELRGEPRGAWGHGDPMMPWRPWRRCCTCTCLTPHACFSLPPAGGAHSLDFGAPGSNAMPLQLLLLQPGSRLVLDGVRVLGAPASRWPALQCPTALHAAVELLSACPVKPAGTSSPAVGMENLINTTMVRVHGGGAPAARWPLAWQPHSAHDELPPNLPPNRRPCHCGRRLAVHRAPRYLCALCLFPCSALGAFHSLLCRCLATVHDPLLDAHGMPHRLLPLQVELRNSSILLFPSQNCTDAAVAASAVALQQLAGGATSVTAAGLTASFRAFDQPLPITSAASGGATGAPPLFPCIQGSLSISCLTVCQLLLAACPSSEPLCRCMALPCLPAVGTLELRADGSNTTCTPAAPAAPVETNWTLVQPIPVSTPAELLAALAQQAAAQGPGAGRIELQANVALTPSDAAIYNLPFMVGSDANRTLGLQSGEQGRLARTYHFPSTLRLLPC